MEQPRAAEVSLLGEMWGQAPQRRKEEIEKERKN